MAVKKAPIYVLPHGIEVIGEHPKGPYIYCTVRPHPLLYNRVDVSRGRVMLTAKLGRRLERSEHVHHGKKGKLVDSYDNISLLTAAEHNKHHKFGTKHRPEVKERIGASMAKAHEEGRHAPPDLSRWTFAGQKHSEATKAKMRAAR